MGYRDELTNEILRLDALRSRTWPQHYLAAPKDTCLRETGIRTNAQAHRANLQPRIWSALYQQNRSPTSMYFRRYFRYQRRCQS